MPINRIIFAFAGTVTLQMGDVESRLDNLKPGSGRQTAAAASKTSSSASKH